MSTRKFDEIISDLEDVTKSVEEAKEDSPHSEDLDEAEDTLERVTDRLEEMEEDE